MGNKHLTPYDWLFAGLFFISIRNPKSEIIHKSSEFHPEKKV
jgi:hypothetical protein